MTLKEVTDATRALVEREESLFVDLCDESLALAGGWAGFIKAEGSLGHFAALGVETLTGNAYQYREFAVARQGLIAELRTRFAKLLKEAEQFEEPSDV